MIYGTSWPLRLLHILNVAKLFNCPTIQSVYVSYTSLLSFGLNSASSNIDRVKFIICPHLTLVESVAFGSTGQCPLLDRLGKYQNLGKHTTYMLRTFTKVSS